MKSQDEKKDENYSKSKSLNPKKQQKIRGESQKKGSVDLKE